MDWTRLLRLGPVLALLVAAVGVGRRITETRDESVWDGANNALAAEGARREVV